jgi:hypothetical protein
MSKHTTLPRLKSVEDISLINVEINTIYKWSQQIADFNYDENRKVLKKICTTSISEIDTNNILYVTSLIELLGSKYINSAIRLHKENFRFVDDDFAETIGKYIDWQTHTAASYTLMMRKAAKIIDYKYSIELKI